MVRFQPPELLKATLTEVIRPDEEPVLKTGGGRAACGFESHGFRFVENRAHGPTGRRRLRTPEIRVRFPVSPLQHNSVPWSSGEDSGLHPGQRWFDSIRDYLRPGTPTAERLGLNPMFAGSTPALGTESMTAWLGRQSADHLGLEPGMLWVRVPPELLE